MLYQQSVVSDMRTLVSPIPGPGGWAAQATAAYKRRNKQGASGLQAQLASRLTSLTGGKVAAGSVWADDAGEMAMAKLDGHTFRLRGEELTLLRSCKYCGIPSFDSPSIRTVEDLGRALAWEPYCQACEPDDEDWSYSW